MRNMPYAFDNTAMVLIEQLSECLVRKPLLATSISADHVCEWANVRKWSFFGWQAKLRGRTVKISRQSLSQGNYYLKYQHTRSGFILFTTLPLIFVSRVENKNFVDFFLLSGPAFKISFLISLPVNSTKCSVIKIKKWNSKSAFSRWLCFFSTEIIGGQIWT